MNTHAYQNSGNDYDSLSAQDLLAARDFYHVHLVNYPHVIAIALGRYRFGQRTHGPMLRADSNTKELVLAPLGTLRCARIRGRRFLFSLM